MLIWFLLSGSALVFAADSETWHCRSGGVCLLHVSDAGWCTGGLVHGHCGRHTAMGLPCVATDRCRSAAPYSGATCVLENGFRLDGIFVRGECPQKTTNARVGPGALFVALLAIGIAAGCCVARSLFLWRHMWRGSLLPTSERDVAEVAIGVPIVEPAGVRLAAAQDEDADAGSARVVEEVDSAMADGVVAGARVERGAAPTHEAPGELAAAADDAELVGSATNHSNDDCPAPATADDAESGRDEIACAGSGAEPSRSTAALLPLAEASAVVAARLLPRPSGRPRRGRNANSQSSHSEGEGRAALLPAGPRGRRPGGSLGEDDDDL